MTGKDKSIGVLLERLRVRMGANAFQVVDYWDADMLAIGVEKPDMPGVLVYISTRDQKRDHYWVSLELPPREEDMPYFAAGDLDAVSFEELVVIIQRHFEGYG